MRACGLIRMNTVVYPASSQKEQLLANRCLNFGHRMFEHGHFGKSATS